MKITEFNSQYNILFNESFKKIDLIMEHLESNLNLLLKANEKYIIYYYEKHFLNMSTILIYGQIIYIYIR